MLNLRRILRHWLGIHTPAPPPAPAEFVIVDDVVVGLRHVELVAFHPNGVTVRMASGDFHTFTKPDEVAGLRNLWAPNKS